MIESALNSFHSFLKGPKIRNAELCNNWTNEGVDIFVSMTDFKKVNLDFLTYAKLHE